ncbi:MULTISPECIES: pyridoxal phosphate-dependent aminotransferase [Terrisporobacter]|nr:MULTISPECIES: histidinol-phosphate transaminase [Terrisporobacter]MCC3668153.1 histidinol-phosphate aminotransferase family protein [Terrisporobacter mayombei]
MNYKINKYIMEEDFLSYAKDEDLSKICINCYDGINTITFSSNVKDAFNNLNYSTLKDYPHGNLLKKSIIDYWNNNICLKVNNIILTEGSINGIYLSNKLFLQPNDNVLGCTPQFPEYAMDVKMHGGNFNYYTLKEENNHIFDEDEFIKLIDNKYKLIYLDNPNNPTGQIISLKQIEKIVKIAKEYKIVIIVDEAYGDYMSPENSSINLINNYDNIIILKTFSKFFSLAGIRAGYMVVPNNFYNPLNKITNPYCINEIGRQMASIALNDNNFINETLFINKKIKSYFFKSLKNLIISHTDKTVAIFLLHHKNPNINLQKEFSKFNIVVVSGCSYMGLDKNYVRLRVPKEKNLEKVLQAFEYIDEL